MTRMTAHEFDQVLAAFSFVLEQVLAEPPAYFDVGRLEALREEIEEIRLLALEKEANAQLEDADLENEAFRWITLMGRRSASDE